MYLLFKFKINPKLHSARNPQLTLIYFIYFLKFTLMFLVYNENRLSIWKIFYVLEKKNFILFHILFVVVCPLLL